MKGKNPFEKAPSQPEKIGVEAIIEKAKKRAARIREEFNILIENTEKELLRQNKSPEEIAERITELIKAEIERIVREKGEEEGERAALEYELLRNIRELKEDPVTRLERRGGFFELAEKAIAAEKKERKNGIKFFRYAGDEFTCLITTKRGQVVTVFADLAYLNRFNDAGGHGAGDLALKHTGAIMKKAATRFEEEGYFERGLSDLELAAELNKILAEESKAVELPEGFKEKGLKIELDLGAASLAEAEEIVEKVKPPIPQDRQLNKKAEIMAKIADRRSEEAKARDRVWEMTMLAREVLMAKSDVDQERAELNFDEALKFSLKGMAGVDRVKLLQLATIENEERLFKQIADIVSANFVRKDRDSTRKITLEAEYISSVARRRIEPFLKYRPRAAA